MDNQELIAMLNKRANELFDQKFAILRKRNEAETSYDYEQQNSKAIMIERKYTQLRSQAELLEAMAKHPEANTQKIFNILIGYG